MRSTPSLDRGRFTLPRDLSAALIIAATLAVAILVLGWLTSGLITGVWSPREQVASVTHSDVKLAAPSEREKAARPERSTKVPTARTQQHVRARKPRAVAPAPRSRRRATGQRRNAPVVTKPAPTATPAPVATAVPVTTATEAQTVPTPTTSTSTATETTTNRRSSASTETPTRSWQDDDSGDRRSDGNRSWRGQSRRRTQVARPVATPAPTPAPVADDDDHGNGNRGRGWDHDRDDRDRGRWGR